MRNHLAAPNQGLDLTKEEEQKTKNAGLPFFSILVILCFLLVIAFLGYLMINPGKKGSDERNIQRSADISTILTTLSAYIKEEGNIPESIPEGESCLQFGHEICKSLGGSDCTGLVDLSFLGKKGDIEEQTVSFPSDPLNDSEEGTGYYIVHDGSGDVTICAPGAERNVSISFEKYMY